MGTDYSTKYIVHDGAAWEQDKKGKYRADEYANTGVAEQFAGTVAIRLGTRY